MSKIVKILTPDNVEIEYRIASMGIRAAAAGVDLLIHAFVVALIAWISWLSLTIADNENALLNMFAIILIVFMAVNYLYFIVCDLLMKGQTIGKRLYQIRVIRANGQGMSLSHVLIREFFRATIDGIGFGFAVMLFSKNSRRIGDMVASTIVVEEEKSQLSYLDLTYQNQTEYNLKKEERNLLQDYFSRKELMDPETLEILESKLLKYFKQKLVIEQSEQDTESFLKSLLK